MPTKIIKFSLSTKSENCSIAYPSFLKPFLKTIEFILIIPAKILPAIVGTAHRSTWQPYFSLVEQGFYKHIVRVGRT